MDNMSETPSRENCFLFNAPDGDISIDDLIDAVEATAGDDSVLALQHMGGSKFLVCTRNSSQATRLMVAEGFRVNHVKVPVEAVGPPVTFVNVYRFPVYLPADTLSYALQPYGKVKSVAFAKVANRNNKLNGVRVVRIEMAKPIPNFLTIQGNRVMCEYRGMRRVCARCGNDSHMATSCTAPYCKRCGVFGHEETGCDEECRKCGGRHGTKACFRGKTYAKSYAGAAWQQPLAEQSPVGNTQLDKDFPPLPSLPKMQVLQPRVSKSPIKTHNYWDGEVSVQNEDSSEEASNKATKESSTSELSSASYTENADTSDTAVSKECPLVNMPETSSRDTDNSVSEDAVGKKTNEEVTPESLCPDKQQKKPTKSALISSSETSNGEARQMMPPPKDNPRNIDQTDPKRNTAVSEDGPSNNDTPQGVQSSGKQRHRSRSRRKGERRGAKSSKERSSPNTLRRPKDETTSSDGDTNQKQSKKKQRKHSPSPDSSASDMEVTDARAGAKGGSPLL